MNWGKLRCLIGFHHRSKSRAWDDAQGRKSICRRCERPMVKDHKGWRLMRRSDEGVVIDR